MPKKREDELNLGAGNRIVKGAVNHDRVKHRPEIDIEHDLNVFPWPWPDNSFDKIAALAVLEHLDVDLITSINECWRILRPGGRLVLKLPMWNHPQSYDDPTHRWFFSMKALDQLCPATERGKRYGFYTDRKWKYKKNPRLSNSKSSFWATLEVIK